MVLVKSAKQFKSPANVGAVDNGTFHAALGTVIFDGIQKASSYRFGLWLRFAQMQTTRGKEE